MNLAGGAINTAGTKVGAKPKAFWAKDKRAIFGLPSSTIARTGSPGKRALTGKNQKAPTADRSTW